MGEKAFDAAVPEHTHPFRIVVFGDAIGVIIARENITRYIQLPQIPAQKRSRFRFADARSAANTNDTTGAFLLLQYLGQQSNEWRSQCIRLLDVPFVDHNFISWHIAMGDLLRYMLRNKRRFLYQQRIQTA